MSKSSLNNGNPNMVQFSGDNIYSAHQHFDGLVPHAENNSFSVKMGNDMNMNISNPNVAGAQMGMGHIINPPMAINQLGAKVTNNNINNMNIPNGNNNIFQPVNPNSIGKINVNPVSSPHFGNTQLNSNLLPSPVPILGDAPPMPNMPNAASKKN